MFRRSVRKLCAFVALAKSREIINNDSASISNESDDLDDVNPPPEFDAFTIFNALST